VPIRIVFAGTPAFSVPALDALASAGHDIAAVYCQPDRPAGRGRTVEHGPVKRRALELGIPVEQPTTLRDPDAVARLASYRADLVVVVAYGLILPPAVLDVPRLGCLNIHASLLPRWRGAAPIQRALLAGDAETGVTIMQMDAGLDTGAMHDVVRIPIAARETGGSLHDKLAAAGASAIVAVLERLEREGAIHGAPQPAGGATYAAKLTRADAAVDWRDSAAAIDRQVRALDPVPGAFTGRGGEPVKLWVAEPAAAAARQGDPGEVLAADADGVVVACGEGALRIAELQPAGGRRMSAAAFVAGRRIAAGQRFDVTPG